MIEELRTVGQCRNRHRPRARWPRRAVLSSPACLTCLLHTPHSAHRPLPRHRLDAVGCKQRRRKAEACLLASPRTLADAIRSPSGSTVAHLFGKCCPTGRRSLRGRAQVVVSAVSSRLRCLPRRSLRPRYRSHRQRVKAKWASAGLSHATICVTSTTHMRLSKRPIWRRYRRM